MNAPRRVAPEAPARRGWCPSLARPMPTGDGLLARVHPPLGRLTPEQARAVAAGARRFGNGHVDVTARANLQIRGVTEATRCGLAEALARVALGDVRGDGGPQRLTLTNPLAGFEPGAFDIPALADAIEALGLAIPGLPPKALVAVESGSRGVTLGAAEADCHLVAGADGVSLHLAGDAGWWHVPVTDVLAVVEAALRLLAASGQRRMRDLAPEDRARLGLRPAPTPAGGSGLRPGIHHRIETGIADGRGGFSLSKSRVIVDGFRRHSGAPQANPDPQGRASGVQSRAADGINPDTTCVSGSRAPLRAPGMTQCHGSDFGEMAPLRDRPACQKKEAAGISHPHESLRVALLVDAPFGRCMADALDTLADVADTLGTEPLRLSSTRGFLLVAPDPEAAETAKRTLAAAGFLTEVDDPRGAVAACPGAPACASGSTPTLADAARLAEAFRPFAARGFRAHVSGCTKGCAHPGAADLTLVGRDGRYDVIVNGRPDGLPATRLPFEAVLERVRRADSASSLLDLLAEQPPGPRPS